LLLSLPLLITAFTVSRPTPLQAPLLPPAFDAPITRQLAEELANDYPNRVPGTRDAARAARWLRAQLIPYGLPMRRDTWRQTIPGLGQVRLENLTAVVNGASPDAIVVMAHRDNTGLSPGANDNATGTAALIELARAYARSRSQGQVAVVPTHTLVFLSTDAGQYGGLGALRFSDQSPFRDRVVAVVNLDALGGDGPPHLQITGDLPRSPDETLVGTAARRIIDESGSWPEHPGFLGQLIDLGFPFTLYEQGPFVARGIPAVTLTTAGNRPPPSFGDGPRQLNGVRFAQMGRSAQQLLGSLDQGLELAEGTTSYVWLGDRMIRGWSIELVLIALLIPYLVGVVDLFAYCRRRRIGLLPAARALRSRLAFWLFAGLCFWAFKLLGAWPAGAPRPPNPETSAADSPALALTGLLVVVGSGWLVTRHRITPRRAVQAEEELAGHAVALIALAIVALLIVATNPFALLFALPALHIWLWLPLLRGARRSTRIATYAAGLVGPLLPLVSLAWRFELGWNAPWYLLELVALGYIAVVPVAIVLAGAAPAGQLAAVAAGRYAPYPDASERGPRGPIRTLVRNVLLALGGSRRAREAPRRALDA
jgi:hypothetical protein